MFANLLVFDQKRFSHILTADKFSETLSLIVSDWIYFCNLCKQFFISNTRLLVHAMMNQVPNHCCQWTKIMHNCVLTSLNIFQSAVAVSLVCTAIN